MQGRQKWRLLGLLSVAMMSCFLVGCQSSADSSSQEPSTEMSSQTMPAAMSLVGQKLPEFTVTNSEGNVISSQEFHGKPMVIVDWASWCPYCQDYLPTVQKLYEQYGQDVHFVMINLTDGVQETQEQAEAYIKEKGYDFPIYFDEGEKVADLLKVDYIPATYIIDKDQTVQQVFDQGLEEKELKKVLESIS